MTIPTNPNVIVGLDRADDAGVYRINDELAMIQTVDFFTPVVDDPYDFGRIAAANALSDIYAMGGVPKTAMNLVGFPLGEMDIAVLRQVIQGGLDTLREADVVLVGGHSVADVELKYGLAVTGFVHPQKVLTKKNLQPRDRLLLTKPLGTGVLSTAVKGGLAPAAVVTGVTQLMAALNRAAAEVMMDFAVHACTDVTGFGLLGHLAEMVIGSGCGVRLESQRVPILPEAREYAAMGLMPAGAFKNKEFRTPAVDFSPSVDPVLQDLFFDPQTSGGLLISVAPQSAEALLTALKDRGISEAAVIGEVNADPRERIRVE